MAIQWPELNRDLCREVSTGTYLTVTAPEFGPDGERLWVVLDCLTGRRHDDPASPWADSIRPDSPVKG